MNKKKIIITIIGIILVSSFLVGFVHRNKKEYIMYDGALLALTIDGSPATAFPTDSSNYHVDIECNGGIGQYQPVRVLDSSGIETDAYEMKFTIEDITKDGVTCNVDFITINDTNKNNYLLKTEVESKATADIDGYRYTGKEPDNWVWFNNEMWRIIGSIPTCTDATIEDGATSGTCNQAEAEKPRLVKIIRAESIGGLAYRSSSSNTTWGSGNTLYTLLNEYYYGKKNATGGSPCFVYSTSGYGLCNYTKIGISNSEEDYYGKMIESVYMNGGTVNDKSTMIDISYDLEIATVTKETKIGLMTASDYGYGTSGITYSSVGLSLLSSYEQNNWLYGQSYEWTMTPNSTSNVMNVLFSGYVQGILSYNGSAVRPVLHLDSNVYIISGSGTILDPYIIGM